MEENLFNQSVSLENQIGNILKKHNKLIINKKLDEVCEEIRRYYDNSAYAPQENLIILIETLKIK